MCVDWLSACRRFSVACGNCRCQAYSCLWAWYRKSCRRQSMFISRQSTSIGTSNWPVTHTHSLSRHSATPLDSVSRSFSWWSHKDQIWWLCHLGHCVPVSLSRFIHNMLHRSHSSHEIWKSVVNPSAHLIFQVNLKWDVFNRTWSFELVWGGFDLLVDIITFLNWNFYFLF